VPIQSTLHTTRNSNYVDDDDDDDKQQHQQQASRGIYKKMFSLVFCPELHLQQITVR
jgi:hypothetical protein